MFCASSLTVALLLLLQNFLTTVYTVFIPRRAWSECILCCCGEIGGLLVEPQGDQAMGSHCRQAARSSNTTRGNCHCWLGCREEEQKLGMSARVIVHEWELALWWASKLAGPVLNL